jgi:outer membrane protein assembly factor BamB
MEYLKLDADDDMRLSRTEVKGTWLDRQFGRFDERPQGADKGDELLTVAEITAAFLKHERGLDGMITTAELEKFYVDSQYGGDAEFSQNELRGMSGGLRDGMGDGPRGTPTVDGERIYTEGGNGDVTCLEAATGKTIWHINLVTDFGGGRPGWGYCESPLIVGELVIVTPGGQKGTVLALNKLTGEKVWQSGDVKDGAHYASPVLATINGVKQIVQFSGKSVFGVTLADGKRLWEYAAPANGTANCCDPIIEGNLVFASSSYGQGGGLAKIIESSSTQQAEEVYFQKRMQCHHGGMVKIGDHVYSNAGGDLLCMEFMTGKIVWQGRGSNGKGSLIAADGMLYLLGEGHEMALAEVTPEAYREHGRFKISNHGRPSWAHPIVARGRLYIRDQESLTAYDLRQP